MGLARHRALRATPLASSAVIHSEPRGHVVVLTIDRPERLNAVDNAALESLGAALDGCGDEVRTVVLTGAGGHFCAGADLAGVKDAGFPALLRSVLDRLRLAPFVTVAAADGAALGAGTQLAVDEWTVARLAALAGGGPARAMLLAAEVLKGDEAHRLGLVQRLGDLADALAWADDIAALAPLTVRAHKAALEPEPDAAAAIARAWGSDDLQEGLAAFRERRRPVFHAR